jgi:hypothetical protein
LPNPADAAELLKKETMKMLRLWIEKFGPGYPKLQRMANFLKNSKSFDWENSEVNLQVNSISLNLIWLFYRLIENEKNWIDSNVN